MSLAIVDAPRCLDSDAFYVGAPRSVANVAPRSRHGIGSLFDTGGTAAYRLRAAHECLDTLGVLRSYREPLEGETWQTPRKSEQRLLAQVNALVALGPPALQLAAELAIDRDVPDPSRVFAALFALGCTAGRRWIPEVRRIFVAAVSRDPGEGAAAVEALSLCPNPDVVGQLESLLPIAGVNVRAAAIQVLAFRGALRESAWREGVSDSNRAVKLAALSAPCDSFDSELCADHLEPLLTGGDELLVAAALRAGCGARIELAHDQAAAIARRDPSWADALQILAMFGRSRGADHIEAALARGAGSVAVRAAATHGAASLIGPLVDRVRALESSPDAIAEIRMALHTITGLSFADVGDMGSEVERWERHARTSEPSQRYRFGQATSPALLLHLLRYGSSWQRSERQRLYLEIQACVAGVPRFSPYDFVTVQLEALAKIQASLECSQRESRV